MADTAPNNGSRIRILDDRVASQIAAGEVVERPVAVVKELMENSLDAGAGRIDVAIEHGGKRLVRVQDDGCGMCPDDALMALERHATSKLREASDLNSVATFGFRGEALPSIASVSRFTMRTRTEGWEAGTEVFVDNGRVRDVRSCGMARGTVMEVAHLFESVPARRKFLKSEKTESAHIVLCCRLLAVAHPDVAFSLREDGREIFNSPVCDNLVSRVGEVFGRELASDLVPVDAGVDGLRLRGLVSKPGRGRVTRAEMFWFANQRPVENRTLTAALLEACRGFVAHGRFPAAFLFLDIDPAALDVNVHPAKREIRLRDEAGVRDFIYDALVERLESLARGSSAGLGCGGVPCGSRPDVSLRPAVSPASFRHGKSLPDVPTVPAPQVVPPVGGAPRLSIREVPPASPSSPEKPVAPSCGSQPCMPSGCAVSSETAAGAAKSESLPSRWRFMGTVHGNYILFETPDGLLSMNHHAALERVLYEDYVRGMNGGALVTQTLLFPHLFELPPLLAGVLSENLAFLCQSGFQVEGFGTNSFRVLAVPAWFDGEACEDFLREAAQKMADNGIRPDRDAGLARDTLARLAAVHAARDKAPVDEKGALELARRLLACRNPLSDSRGGATYVEFGHRELSGGGRRG